MPIVVRVVSQEEYTKWVGEKKKALAAAADDPNKHWDVEELVARGEKVYAANCVACHQATGQGTPRVPAARRLQDRRPAPKEGQIDIVLNGRPNTAMAAFGKQLSDTEIAAVITYARNSWGNKASEVPARRSEGAAQDRNRRTHELSRRHARHGHAHDDHGHDHHGALRRPHALDHHHQPQGHRHDVPVVQLHHVPRSAG